MPQYLAVTSDTWLSMTGSHLAITCSLSDLGSWGETFGCRGGWILGLAGTILLAWVFFFLCRYGCLSSGQLSEQVSFVRWSDQSLVCLSFPILCPVSNVSITDSLCQGSIVLALGAWQRYVVCDHFCNESN